MRTDSPAPPEANPPVRRGPMPDGPAGFVRESAKMAWRWLTRMRTALYLLALLGLETLLATVVPQQPNVPATVTEWRQGTSGPGTVVSGIIDALGGYDVYGSAIFLALLLLLFLSLTACLIPRYRALWRVWRRTRPPRSRNLGSQEQQASFGTDHSPDEVHAVAREILGRRRWRLRDPATDRDQPPQVAAEKGHVLREGGSLVFHTSFYVLLVGVVAGQLLGFSGQVGVVEGQDFTETGIAYWSRDPGRLWDDTDHRGFTLALDEFHVDWHRDPAFGGQPRLFNSEVTITEPDGTTYNDTVGGNDPLLVDGMKIHQLDWGYAPRVQVEVDGRIVHDGYLTLNTNDSGFWEGAVKAPSAEPGVGLDIVFWPYAPAGEDGTPTITGAPWADAPLLFFEEYRGDLQLEAAQNVNELDKTELTQTGVGGLRPGGEVTLDDGVTVRFLDLRRWVGFQISNRPTVPLLLFGSLLVLAGLITALYAYRRRLWVEGLADPVTGRTLVTVAGRAFQRPQAFEDEFADLAAELRKRLSDDSRPIAADHPTDHADPVRT